MNLKSTNTFLLILLVLVSLGLSAALLRRSEGTPTALTPQIQTREEAINRLKASFWDIYPSMIIPNDNIIIPDTISLKRDDEKVFSLKNLVNGKDKLVFRYSATDCEICLDSVMSSINTLTKNIKHDGLIIITDSKNERDFLIKAKNKKHQYPIYNIMSTKLGLPFEDKGYPFLFILTKDFRSSKIFVPFKEVNDQTKEYLTYAFNFLRQ